MEDDRCDDRLWGFLATDVSDAPACISSCRQDFLKALMLREESFERLCEQLVDMSETSGQDDPFWGLYCCDSQLCGVDNLKNLGQDRTVFPWPCL